MTNFVPLNRESNTITIANFWENYLLGKYSFNPPYQRQSVWSDEKQSFLIDSILKNFPIPPIFLHQKIDDTTGKTKYDVIDGKQRLTSIIRFIKNEIPASGETDSDEFSDVKVSGIYFRDLDNPVLTDYKKRFWRYVIPIEYIDTANIAVIENIFDRLNRNGEPLRGQELRNSTYHNSQLLHFVGEIKKLPFWEERLKYTDLTRMEDIEFLSELIFVILEGGPLHANQDTLDEMYLKYANASCDWAEIKDKFVSYTKFLEDLELDYVGDKITGVSHLYGLWCLAKKYVENGTPAVEVKDALKQFYKALRSDSKADANLESYKKSMSSRTKDKGQRLKRLAALEGYLTVDPLT